MLENEGPFVAQNSDPCTCHMATVVCSPSHTQNDSQLPEPQINTQPPSTEPSTSNRFSLPQKVLSKEFEVFAADPMLVSQVRQPCLHLTVSCSSVIREGPQGGKPELTSPRQPLYYQMTRDPATRKSPILGDPSPRAREFQVGTWPLQPRS